MTDENNDLNIGAARVKIRIPDDFFPYQSFYGRLYTGMHDDLHARCIIIGNRQASALILSIDLGDLGDIDMWLEKVSRLSGVPVSHIMLTVTHTHSAPHVSDSFDQPVKDIEKTKLFNDWFWEAVSEAVRQAKSNMRPGRIGYGTGECNININRDFEYKGSYIMGPNPHGYSDKTVAVIKFEDSNGKPVAYLSNYAVHGSVTFYFGGMLVSADLPGETSRYIEKRHDDKVVALWTSGAAGDQNARYMANRLVFDSDGNIREVTEKEGCYLLARVQGEALADEILLVAANMPKTAPKAVIRGIHRKISVPGQKKLEEHLEDFSGDVLMPHSKIDTPKYYEDAGPVTMHLSLLQIDHIILLGIPGELVSRLGIMVRDAIPYRNAMVVTHCNGSLSYICDESGYEKRTFQAGASHIKRGCAEKALVQATIDMIDELEGIA